MSDDSESDDGVNAVVIDNGSAVIKAGFAGDDIPQCMFPSVIGKHHESDDSYVGNEAQNRREMLALKYPIQHKMIVDWGDMEKVWHHIFTKELSVSPEEQPVLLAEPPLHPKSNREKITQVMFEEFNVPAMHLANQGVLALYSAGRTTGVTVDIGEGVTNSIPVYEGYNLPHAILKTDLAGRSLTDYLNQLLNQKGHDMYTPLEKDFVRDIKEERCCVALDFTEEIQAPLGSVSNQHDSGNSLELPDGQILTIENERFQCPEALFQPSLVGRECYGLHELTHNSIMKVDLCVRKDLYNNIVLVGGSTLFPGLSSRVQKEIAGLAPNAMHVKVLDPQNASKSGHTEHSVWCGGSVLASVSSFEQMWVRKDEYDDHGPNIVHKKCF